MLSPQETDIARYDVALPGLATVLDPDAFLVELRRAAPAADLRRAAIAYAKIKPREYCRATYRLEVAGAEINADVCACRREDVGSWLEELEDAHGSGPLGPGFIVLPDLAILVSVFPHDLDLQSLRSLADGVERQRLLRASESPLPPAERIVLYTAVGCSGRHASRSAPACTTGPNGRM